ncbi:hypothetical protein Tco_1500631 [Tanacetum coccineum]
MGTVSRVIASNELRVQFNKVILARVLNDLSGIFLKKRKEYKADIRATNILLHKESNFDQLYAYLKQHEVHANENRTIMERLLQPTNDPLALVSNASVQQYLNTNHPVSSSSMIHLLLDNFQLTSDRTPQTNNQLRTSSNARNKATVQDGRVVIQDVCGRYNANNQGRPFQRNNARGNVDSYYFKDKMLLMQSQENGAVLDEEHSLFLAGEQVTNFNDDVDDSPQNDWHQISYGRHHEFTRDAKRCINTTTVVDTKAEYNEYSNIILYNQYLERQAKKNGVQSNVSCVQNDALMSTINEMHEEGVQSRLEGVQSRLANKPDKVV